VWIAGGDAKGFQAENRRRDLRPCESYKSYITGLNLISADISPLAGCADGKQRVILPGIFSSTIRAIRADPMPVHPSLVLVAIGQLYSESSSVSSSSFGAVEAMPSNMDEGAAASEVFSPR
jgi:hypothetical protein